MSEQIKHECGIALVRLLKPLEYYPGRYGTSTWALNKLHLLMEKQHNRGQDGAGIACIKFDPNPGSKYINRFRSNSNSPISDVFKWAYDEINAAANNRPDRLKDIYWLKDNSGFAGELFLGHLRYGTFGKNNIQNLHPVLRANNWMTRNLVLAGNFNMTNVDELFSRLLDLGQYPVETSDTITILEKIGHFLDEENERLYAQFKAEGYNKKEITSKIARALNVGEMLKQSAVHWDGGYAIAGMLGHGDAFVLRDPSGIRPAYYYQDDEVVVVASERPAIQTAMNVHHSRVNEIEPGCALIIERDGTVHHTPILSPLKKQSCSFERIYFSRGTDVDIYRERKRLGQMLTPLVLKAVNHDFKNTVFSYIPNTAAVAFYGLVEQLGTFCDGIKKERLLKESMDLTPAKIDEIFTLKPRIEKLAVKDIKLRTFITQDNARDDLVAHVYDVTYGVVKPGIDSLVVLDDSVVRGTTLRKSIIRILDRLNPKKIVVASSAPQIRYPDCYGIDMTKLGDFIAFNAAIELLKETRQGQVINEVYLKCKAQEKLPKEEVVNFVKEIYRPFTAEQISAKISQLVTPAACQAEVQLVFQTIEDLHQAIPEHTGDWYFTGNYPTPGGNKVVNRSFINYIEGRNERAY
ncbi:MAG: amidophosphoribosyltransferase [Lentimicrobium sp.]|jgi:amidophosphoribosyltransferase|nr:amidophosphoribosyltransferase [Lentimicrobium sp.]MDD2527983.1 amidophosphoribosyltransferase [Lentimicrobiaceae bacterium]MDD4597203.1 amidophosphoribosyltransferase [Lentimicrobiaceae bacterium]MDY0025660.1 amidophosphoribosyltransferase [Lentimicrobium sp.]HAH58132.1 amidophosphoribosyltransferase [Bacteroidales bacterium]